MKAVQDMTAAELLEEQRRREANRRAGRPLAAPLPGTRAVAERDEADARADKAIVPAPHDSSYQFLYLLRVEQMPLPEQEHRFAAPRKWRFDFAWPDAKVALEVEGGVWTNGRHTRGSGFLRDMEKYNEAGRRGWRVFRCTPSTLRTLATVHLIGDALALQVGA